jgi:hypothetical protein
MEALRVSERIFHVDFAGQFIFWIQFAVQCVTTLLYMWSLIAPLVLKSLHKKAAKLQLGESSSSSSDSYDEPESDSSDDKPKQRRRYHSYANFSDSDS